MANREGYKEEDFKSKGLIAFRRLKNFEEQVNNVQDKLEEVSGKLKRIIDNEEQVKDENFPKLRSMFEEVPKRIGFKSFGFKFYVDFTVEASIQDEKFDVKGSIIYGTNRSLCFARCPVPKNGSASVEHEKPQDCEAGCDRIGRCDKLEDKPLVKLLMDRDGMILSQDKFEGELWLHDNTKSLRDLHFRVLDNILEEAIYWVNEKLLP